MYSDRELTRGTVTPPKEATTVPADQAGRAPIEPLVPPARYELLGEIARGGLGRIFRAHDRHLKRIVALKLLKSRGESADARFVREALVTARLQHPAIVPIYDAGWFASGEPYYAMRLVDGQPLDLLVRAATSFDDRLALVPHVAVVADAVAYAHDCGFVHRDLKPENVLVGRFGETVVIDWGLARLVDALDPAECDAPATRFDDPYETLPVRMTREGTVMGTPSFMAPEQARGEPVDQRADVYALGATLYHCLSGRYPHEVSGAKQMIEAVANQPAPHLSTREPRVPRELAAIVAKAMAFDPKDRYADARELSQDLRRFLRGQLVAAHRYAPRELFFRWVRRHAALLAVTGLAVGAIAATGAVSIARVVSARDEARRAQEAAVDRADELLVRQARSDLDVDTRQTVEWLARLSPRFARWQEAREIAEEAVLRGVPFPLDGHTGDVWTVAYSPDGRLLASAGADKRILVWDRERDPPSVARTFVAHDDDITGLAFAGTTLVSSSVDGTIQKHDLSSGASTVHRRHDTRLFTLAVAGEVIVSGGENGAVFVDALGDATTSARYQEHVGGVNAVALNPERRWFVSGGEDGNVVLRELPDGVPRTIVRLGRTVAALAVSPDGREIAALAADGFVRFFDSEGRRTADTPSAGHRGKALSVDYSRDGRLVVTSGAADHTVRILDRTSSGLRVQRLPFGVHVAVVSPDGREIVAGGASSSLSLLPARTPETAYPFDAKPRRVAVPDRDATWFAVALDDQRVVVVDGAVRRELRFDAEDRVDGLAVSGAANRVAVGTRAGLVEVLAPDLSPVWSTRLDTMVHDVAFSPDGKLLAVATLDGGTRVFDASGEPVATWQDGAPTYAVAFSADGGRLAVGTWTRQARIHDLRDPEREPIELAGHERWVVSVAFSPDGTRLASASTDRTVRLWDAVAGTALATLPVGDEVHCVRWSLDGAHLAAATDGGIIRVWDAATLEPLDARKLGYETTDFAVTPRGELVATGSDGFVRVFRFTAPREPASLRDFLSGLENRPPGRR